MKGGMIIKEILACIRGRRLSPVNGRREKGGGNLSGGFFDTMAAEEPAFRLFLQRE